MFEHKPAKHLYSVTWHLLKRILYWVLMQVLDFNLKVK